MSNTRFAHYRGSIVFVSNCQVSVEIRVLIASLGKDINSQYRYARSLPEFKRKHQKYTS